MSYSKASFFGRFSEGFLDVCGGFLSGWFGIFLIFTPHRQAYFWQAYFKNFLFLPLLRKMIQLDKHIFQMGWWTNHHLVCRSREVGFDHLQFGFGVFLFRLNNIFESPTKKKHHWMALMKSIAFFMVHTLVINMRMYPPPKITVTCHLNMDATRRWSFLFRALDGLFSVAFCCSFQGVQLQLARLNCWMWPVISPCHGSWHVGFRNKKSHSAEGKMQLLRDMGFNDVASRSVPLFLREELKTLCFVCVFSECFKTNCRL